MRREPTSAFGSVVRNAKMSLVISLCLEGRQTVELADSEAAVRRRNGAARIGKRRLSSTGAGYGGGGTER